MIYKGWIFTLAIVPVLLLTCTCTTDKNITGNGSQTGNPAVVGILYQPDGITPAAGVRVHIRPQKTLADTSGTGLTKRLAILAATDSVVTDSAGRYAFDTTLDTGTYVVEAASGNNAVLIDSVAVISKTAADTLAPDTLKPAGALKGVIKLSEGGDPRKVFVLAFGIDRFARVNADGSFKFSGLAEAKYDLRLISSLDNYGVLDTVGVPVRSADTTNLDTVSLPFTGIPTPKNVKISYDTLKQIVTLLWSKADTSLVKGFNVYRRSVDSSFGQTPLNGTTLVRDTVYRDSTAIQDQSYEYKIVALDKGDNAGKMSAGDSVRIESAFTLQTTIGNGSGTGDGYITYLRAVALDDSGSVYVADAGNHRIQRFSSAGVYAAKWGTNGSGKGQFGDIADMAMDSTGNIFVVESDNNRVQKLTSNGDTLLQWGSLGTTDGAFQSPVRITVHKDKVYIGEWNGQRVQQFDLNGTFISKFDVGQPVSAVCANDSLVFVMINDRAVLKYAVSGQFIDTIFTSRQQVNNCALFNDLLCISNLGANKIQGIDFKGSLIFQFALPPMQDGTPQDIAVQSERALFVARYAGYVQEFTRK